MSPDEPSLLVTFLAHGESVFLIYPVFYELNFWFAGYVYPDAIGDGGVCDMYEGVPCQVDDSKCCYNVNLWCPEGSDIGCGRYDRGAYPLGDERVFKGQMTDPLSLSPFPNAILWNWCTIFVLMFGNVAALDFQARCMASKTSVNASRGCYIAGCVTLFVGIPFSFLGAITRYVAKSENLFIQHD